jgi:hypothetical protein
MRVPKKRADRRKLHNEGFHNLYSWPGKITMVKSRRIRSVGNVACMGRRAMHTWSWWESQKERDHWDDVDVGGKNIKINFRQTGWGSMD